MPVPTTDPEAIYESLSLFDQPERDRPRGFLPRNVDIDALLRALFAPLEEALRR